LDGTFAVKDVFPLLILEISLIIKGTTVQPEITIFYTRYYLIIVRNKLVNWIMMEVWWSSFISRVFRQEPKIKNKPRHQNTPCCQIRLHLTVKSGYGHLILGWL